MPAKVEAVVLQVNARGLRKYNAAETLVGLAGTLRYLRVQACAINQPSDVISFKKFRWLEREASIYDLSKYKVHLL